MIYRFGLFEFDAAKGELRKGGQVVAIERQPAKLLGLLLEKRGELVSKDEVRTAVWGEGTHVDFDRGIAYCVSAVRAALGDDGTRPLYVETKPRQGYRFIAPVEVKTVDRRGRLIGVAGGVAVAGWALWPKVVRMGVSIFDNETGRAELDRWVAGLSDVTLARLEGLAPGKLEWVGNAPVLRRARNIRDLKTVRRELDVDYVLLGQLQKQGEGLRFVTHLIRTRDEAHLKANRIVWTGADVEGLEGKVVAEYEAAVRKHVLKWPEVGA
jgi:DNA-binding winged helix-turn-helix (wHTH) protein/TolB-like protein